MKSLNAREILFITLFLIIFILFSLIGISVKSSEIRTNVKELKRETSMFNLSNSIVFYVIIGSTQDVLKPGYQDNYWQKQLMNFEGNYTVHYISDGPMKLKNVNIDPIIMPIGSNEFTNDRQLCIRTSGTWKHFVQNHPDAKWYYRGTHDSYVNMTAMLIMINELEKQGDPMTTPLMAYNFHEYNHIFYPQGGAGYLFSNYAIKKFYEDVDYFFSACCGSFDDVTLGHFIGERLKFDLRKFQTPNIIVTFPFTQLDLIRKQDFTSVEKCPEYYYLVPGNPYGLKPCPVHKAISIHMHGIDVTEASELLEKVPDDYYVYFRDQNTPRLCHM